MLVYFEIAVASNIQAIYFRKSLVYISNSKANKNSFRSFGDETYRRTRFYLIEDSVKMYPILENTVANCPR
jgi:hypothetical protein